MNRRWTDDGRSPFSNDFSLGLKLARDPDPAIRATAHPALAAVEKLGAAALLFKALNSAAPTTPVFGHDKRVQGFISPSSSAADSCVGLILGKDSKGPPLCPATNRMQAPAKSDASLPTDVLAAFAKITDRSERERLIHSLISSAALDQPELVARVLRESKRFWTKAIFLLVLDGKTKHLYPTSAIINVPRLLSDQSLEFTEVVR